ncbi:peptidyl-prolyl cis-trans isomerase E-like [Vanessa atalanta]|uniref:peptidyl-prolyl cis-trans isomerase E-like n=1 Tax=Vanessa atalanta TaxID=42275 RepID=UPI001FCCFD46|nr:peptidyl-prolyl cis-trans isomerase E-like [Vanessa atalanta]
MTLMGAILRKVQSRESVGNDYGSPPPEIDETLLRRNKIKKRTKKEARVRAIVDSSSPYYNELRMYRSLPEWKHRLQKIYLDNIRILFAIVTAYLNGGWVDSHWSKLTSLRNQYHHKRVRMYEVVNRENKEIYKRIKETNARVVPTTALNKAWTRNKRDIIRMSKNQFILFPVQQLETIEDVAFKPPNELKRPRANITLRMRDAAIIGTMAVELFVDVCPATCQLFLELLDGDGLGYGYVGTQFFRKVPGLYWSGGDVVHNNGCGCYAQRGRVRPITAENYHYSHSMPGLLSMRVMSDELVCGVFNITFKPLPQFDLKNVVFGRIIRPCSTYEVIRTLGSPLNSHPIIEIAATGRKVDKRFIRGTLNTKLQTNFKMHK